MLFASSSLVFLTVILNSVQAQIVKFTATPTPCSQCTHTTDNLGGGSISCSDNYYTPIIVVCTWNIIAPEEYRIHLNITSLNIPESTPSCAYFRLIINAVVGENSTESKLTFCGTETSSETFVFWNRVNLEYAYSGRSQAASFTLLYRAVIIDIGVKTAKWISDNEEALLSDKESLPRGVTALGLFDETYFSKQSMKGYKFRTQYLLKLSEDLLRNYTEPLSIADLSHHVFALLSVCVNPRSFRGIDLVHQLKRRMERTPNSVKPFDLLALCKAGENLVPADINKISAMLHHTEKPNIYMLDFQAIAVLALICAKEQNRQLSVDEYLKAAANDLKSYQKEDGSFGSLRSTVLIMQALSASGANDTEWNKTLALRFIQKRNPLDGSFGNIYDMYTVLPVLKGKTLLDLNATKCAFSPDGITPLEEVKDKMTKLIKLTYQLWVGDGVDVKHTTALKFANGTNFFNVMRLAAENDKKFYLKWTFTKGDLYIYEIAGHINDPTAGKYWNLYLFNETEQLFPFEGRLETYIPRDGDTAVMWYKTVEL